MVIVVVFSIGIFLRALIFRYIRMRLSLIDGALTLFYGFMVMTAVYALNTDTALRMVVGIIFLLVAYYVVRFCLSIRTIDEIHNCLFSAAVIFFAWSFLWYMIGIVLHFYFGTVLVLSGETLARAELFGVY